MGAEVSTTFAMQHTAVKNVHFSVTGLCTQCRCTVCSQSDCAHDESLKEPIAALPFEMALHIAGTGNTPSRTVYANARQTHFYDIRK